MKRQLGFGVLPLIAIIVVVGVIGLLGYTLWQRANPSPVATNADQQSVDAAPTIKNKRDLDAALRTLDTTDITGTSATQLDTESNF